MYNTLEYRMHIAKSYEELELLDNEGDTYLSDGTLDAAEPLGFFYKQKWDREYAKRLLDYVQISNGAPEGLISLDYQLVTLGGKTLSLAT